MAVTRTQRSTASPSRGRSDLLAAARPAIHDALGRRRLTTRATRSLAVAGIRYWTVLAPYVHAQIAHWQRRAEQIEDPALRGLALQKLAAERFNAEAAAMIATPAPVVHRRAAVRAIVALELMYDYLDGLTEQPLADPLADGEALYATFLEALDPDATSPHARDSAATHAQDTAGGRVGRDQGSDSYLQELADTARAAIAELPARAAIAQPARRCALRGAKAQVLMHAAPRLGTADLERWAREEARQTALPWRDFLAGAACSILTLHALIAAAAQPGTTEAQAQRIEDAYLPGCALMTLLDGVIDAERDRLAGQLGYAGLYASPQLLADALVRCARESRRACTELPGGEHHAMVIASGIAYWVSAPGASGEAAAPMLAPLRRELGPLLTPPLLLLRLWREAKRMRASRCSCD